MNYGLMITDDFVYGLLVGVLILSLAMIVTLLAAVLIIRRKDKNDD